MKKTFICLMALCLMGFSACTNQQKESNGPLPVADFEKEYPEKDLLVSEHADVEYVRLETTDEVLLDAGANLLFHSMPEFNEAWETLKKYLHS